LPFLDINIYRSGSGFLGHRVYRKPTHKDQYLNATSYHHLGQKLGVISTLTHRANISHEYNLHMELAHLRSTSRKNTYSPTQIHRELWPRGRRPRETDNKQKPTSTAFLPYVHNLSNHISKILAQYNIETIHLPPLETHSILRPVKDSLGLMALAVYKIPYKCRVIYIGETGCKIKECKKEHQPDLQLYHPE
jgi:hypothetical protein